MKHFLIALSALGVMIGFGVHGGGNIFAQSCSGATTTEGAISCGVGGTTGVPVTGTPEVRINSTITKIINYLSLVGGILAVIFLIVGGYKYITSGGDANKTSSAKSTIVYALIGLVVVVLAQVVVRFVLNRVT